jgi:hypothetical protein
MNDNRLVFKCDDCPKWFHDDCCFGNTVPNGRLASCPNCRSRWTNKNAPQDFVIHRPGPVIEGQVTGGGKNLRSTRHRQNRKSNSKKSKKRRRKTR